MNILSAKIRKIISGNSPSFVGQKALPLDFIQSRKGIFRELIISKESGNLIGIFSALLGEGMFLITVKSVEVEGQSDEIVFARYEIGRGYAQSTQRLSIAEISGICPFYQKRTS